MDSRSRPANGSSPRIRNATRPGSASKWRCARRLPPGWRNSSAGRARNSSAKPAQGLAGSEAQTINARQDLDRAVELMDKGVGQQSSVDRGTALWEAAVATEKAERENLERLLNGTTAEELQQAEASLQAAVAPTVASTWNGCGWRAGRSRSRS